MINMISERYHQYYYLKKNTTINLQNIHLIKNNKNNDFYIIFDDIFYILLIFYIYTHKVIKI